MPWRLVPAFAALQQQSRVCGDLQRCPTAALEKLGTNLSGAGASWSRGGTISPLEAPRSAAPALRRVPVAGKGQAGLAP